MQYILVTTFGVGMQGANKMLNLFHDTLLHNYRTEGTDRDNGVNGIAVRASWNVELKRESKSREFSFPTYSKVCVSSAP